MDWNFQEEYTLWLSFKEVGNRGWGKVVKLRKQYQTTIFFFLVWTVLSSWPGLDCDEKDKELNGM